MDTYLSQVNPLRNPTTFNINFNIILPLTAFIVSEVTTLREPFHQNSVCKFNISY